jgi:hypothetical protein
MIDQVLCVLRRTSSLLTPVLSPTGFFCAVIPVLHDCSLCNLQGAAIPRLAGRNCSRLGHSLSSVSLGTGDGDAHSTPQAARLPAMHCCALINISLVTHKGSHTFLSTSLFPHCLVRHCKHHRRYNTQQREQNNLGGSDPTAPWWGPVSPCHELRGAAYKRQKHHLLKLHPTAPRCGQNADSCSVM